MPLIPTLLPTLLYEDTHLIVLDKPAGLLSQGEHTGDENLVDWLRQYLGRPYVGLIHRLDRNTSGIMVVAKRTKSAQRLTNQLQAGTIERSYLAWLEGRLAVGETRWRHFLRKDPASNRTQVVPASASGAKDAILVVKSVASGFWSGKPLTLAEFKLETGRSHQIRAQSSQEGHPLLGDAKYGSLVTPSFGRPALHSHQLKFEHPMTHETVSYQAPLPADMAKIQQIPLK